MVFHSASVLNLRYEKLFIPYNSVLHEFPCSSCIRSSFTVMEKQEVMFQCTRFKIKTTWVITLKSTH